MGAFALFVVILLALLVLGPVLQAAAWLTLDLVISAFFWMLAGMFAGRLIRGRGYGPVGDVLLGLAGGVVGSLVLGLLGIGGLGRFPLIGGILVGVIGAVILVWVIRLLGHKTFGA
jgi:uncharacterized membrane protein YeaQ/YmgE (transglycosylase-associated protein family)